MKKLKPRNTIGHKSIKESMDHLPTGLCFSTWRGDILLSNERMKRLCLELTGKDIHNGESFWHFLQHETTKHIERIGNVEDPTYRMKDGSIWRFRRALLSGAANDVIQLSATDLTELYQINEDLERDNARLAAMNLRLEQYGKDVDALTKENEFFATKIKVHDELGRALLLTRHYLGGKNEDVSPVLEQWKRNITALADREREEAKEDPLARLQTVAKAAGITVIVDGELPDNPKVQSLIYAGASQSLTNAVKHAVATTLKITCSKIKDKISVRYTNNGKKPTEPIVEGGGLCSLRSQAEQIGAVMAIEWQPEFAILLMITENRGEEL